MVAIHCTPGVVTGLSHGGYSEGLGCALNPGCTGLGQVGGQVNLHSVAQQGGGICRRHPEGVEPEGQRVTD